MGAVASLSAMALVSIGVSTDNWTHTTVDRSSVRSHGEGNNTEYMFHTRNTGLFRICFPEKDRPNEDTPGLYLSVVDDWCYARNFYLNEMTSGVFTPEGLSSQGSTHLQLHRTTPILLFAYLFSMGCVGLLGLCGCWQQSANKLITTAAFQLLAALVGASAMATWHAALFFEMEKVHDPGFPLTWPDWLQESTTVETSWSYILTWIGVCLTLLASLATSAAAICLRSRRRTWEDDAMRMKLKVSRMFAQHAYFPDDIRSSPSLYEREYQDYPTMPANFPTQHKPYSPRGLGSEIYLQADRKQEYKKVVSQLEDSRF
jgi:hypothetical protein